MRVGSRPRCWGTVGIALVAILVGGLVACKTPQPAIAPAGVKKPPPLSFHAERGPITALAWDDPFLWIGTDRGLRRYRQGTDEALWLTHAPALAGHRIKALAPAGGPSLLVGTPAGNPLAWRASDRGLFLSDGAGVHLITPATKNAIGFLQADADGHSAWVGVAGQGLLHVDRHGTLEAFGPASPGAPDFTDALGMGSFPNGPPFAVGRGRDGSGRLLILHKGGPALFEVEPSLRLVGAAMEHGEPLVNASKGGPAGGYTQ